MDFKFYLIFAASLAGLECSRILVLYPTISKSHIIPLQTLSLALAKKGHDITFVSTYPLGKQVENYRDIRIPFEESDKDFINEMLKDPNGKGALYMFPRLTSLLFRLGNETLQMPEMRKLMNEEKFDLLIVGFFLNDFVLGLGEHFNCPTILFSPAGAFNSMLQAIGNPLGVSGTPHLVGNIGQLNFIGRLKNFLITGFEMLAMKYVKYRQCELYK